VIPLGLLLPSSALEMPRARKASPRGRRRAFRGRTAFRCLTTKSFAPETHRGAQNAETFRRPRSKRIRARSSACVSWANGVSAPHDQVVRARNAPWGPERGNLPSSALQTHRGAVVGVRFADERRFGARRPSRSRPKRTAGPRTRKPSVVPLQTHPGAVLGVRFAGERRFGAQRPSRSRPKRTAGTERGNLPSCALETHHRGVAGVRFAGERRFGAQRPSRSRPKRTGAGTRKHVARERRNATPAQGDERISFAWRRFIPFECGATRR
jgi:hypothetical protein